MKLIVLAAGFATRLYPLTQNQAKPLLDIAGRPMLSRLLDKALKLPGIDEVIVIGNEKFAANFEEWRKSYPSPVPLRVLNDGSTDDSNKLGAVGDLGFAFAQIPGEFECVVVAGDNLLAFELAPFLEEFRRRNAPLLMLRRVQLTGGKSRYNEVRLSEGGRVIYFKEKPENPESNLMAICLYHFTPEVKGLVARYLAEGNNPDAPGYFIQWLVGQVPVYGIEFDSPWFDIGNFETLEAARRRFAEAGE